MSAICREGHLSDEPDYCSVCGAPILVGRSGSPGGTPIPIPMSARVKDPPSTAGACPSCGEPQEDPSARFCEVCRYDFLEQRPGPPPVARAGATRPAATVAPAPAAPAPAAPAAAAPAAPTPADPAAAVAAVTPSRAWEIVIVIDPSLDTEPDPAHPCPAERPEIVLPIDKPDLLVGRHDDTRAIHPEVSLHDPGASRRHAKFVLEPDGGVALQDLASTNGTQVNGQDVPPGTRRRLREGDQVTLGRWTRITLRGRA
jgi:FHA domain